MSSKRNYINEILEKRSRNNQRSDRYELSTKRIHPVVSGFRAIKNLDNKVSFRNEWLKYGAIGYIAALEGYYRLLIADLINLGNPYRERVTNLRDIKFTTEVVIAIHDKKVSLGEFVSHLLPINKVGDIDSHLSTLLDISFLKELKEQPINPPYNEKPYGQVFPDAIGNVEQLFQLRHIYAHELATKERVPIRKLENYISSAAGLIIQTEEYITNVVGINA